MKKVLLVASVISFIEWFNKENVEYLKNECGCEVHIACNFDYMNDTDINRTVQYIEELQAKGIILHNIAFSRSPMSLGNVKTYNMLKEIIESEHFDLIHCHTPTASVLTRLAARSARKKGCVVMYTSHGFHFHNASSIINWIIYYPIERLLSRFCDYLITINREDFERAKTLHCKNVRYIPGVGVDVHLIKALIVDREEKRMSIGIPKDKFLIISAGELIPRKNHEVIIKAMGKIKNPNIFYAIAGKGPLEEHLKEIARKEGVSNQVVMLGFRTDIFELYHAADISAFPSKIEGLGLAGIEAMAAGLPLVSSNVHGILDYVVNRKTGFAIRPDDIDGFATAIRVLAEDNCLREQMRNFCVNAVEKFELSCALRAMWSIYREALVSTQCVKERK